MEKTYDVTKIDFSELRNQKRVLLAVSFELEKQKDLRFEELDGIVGLIDSIQDFVCDELDYNPNHVYDIEAEDTDYKPTPLWVAGTTDGHIHPDEPEEEEFARNMSNLIYDIHRESEYLYMSEEFVETILNMPENQQACKERIRLEILKDYALDPDQFQRDPETNKLWYDASMHDYGFNLEGYCLEKFYEGKTKTVHLCRNCGSDNVEMNHRINLKTNQVTKPTDSTVYCTDCGEATIAVVAELKFLSEVIGFQVVGEGNCEGQIHPKMKGSFCIYNLTQAKRMLKDSQVGERWHLLTLWTGDVEEPTLMYEGNPRD